MTARDLLMLKFDRETPATLRSALEALDELKPTNPKHIADIAEMRGDFTQELQLLEGQGSLF